MTITTTTAAVTTMMKAVELKEMQSVQYHSYDDWDS